MTAMIDIMTDITSIAEILQQEHCCTHNGRPVMS